jgi:hypothetical protein
LNLLIDPPHLLFVIILPNDWWIVIARAFRFDKRNFCAGHKKIVLS